MRAPPLGVDSAFPGSKPADGAKGFEFQEVGVGKGLEGAAEIRVSRKSDRRPGTLQNSSRSQQYAPHVSGLNELPIF